ncbi:MAG: glycosyltransferase family 39 protein [Crocinitomicaceae bacterium]
MDRQKIQARFSDIRTWLTFFFLVRFVGIANAPLEIGHSWRQSLTNMTARNFYENGIDLLHPMIDMAGEKSGILGSEFPFFNALIALMADVFGYEHWYGRLINLIVSTLGLYFFYKLIRAILNEKIAFSSTLVLCVSIWFGFSRKSMPDTFSVSLVIIALYGAYLYLKEGKWLPLFAFFTLATLGILCKIPALALLSVLGVAPFVSSIPVKRIGVLNAFGALSVGVVGLWYFYWVPYLVKTYGFELYINKGLTLGCQEIWGMKAATLEKFYFSAFHSYVALATFLVGLYFLIKKGNSRIWLALSLYTFVFFVFVILTGDVFPKHSYYVIPFVPLMALVVGYFFAEIPPKYATLLLAIIAIESIANQQHDFFIKGSEKYKLTLEPLVEKTIPKDSKIVINGGDSPQHIYFAHRKGWTVDSDKILRTDFVDSLSNLGAQYLIVDKQAIPEALFFYTKASSNTGYVIYQLNRKTKPFERKTGKRIP